ncbi:hypothetical protein [Acinetobacter pittii]|jgi:hypothetical protein|uniref:Uncharacterized protein n=1 Tax=Acinetobacter johnsonii TaxID=40214 RepID=A0A2W5T112_ACIJO|nr:hypothetical protein [Acinetobacter pittii]MBP6437154.1 hypothetical protein [Paludibacteraceae bacterium]PZQ85183.1 MAG: hypothetical protein DI542_16455 [Acinetobacter johnsonii]MCU4346074.1 hypothetical protein [Acinetobacter pittii]MCU4356500.1 hypothetical protein [Acinetobacter pittii]PPC26990.1 hypothetical protein ApiMCR16048_18595 [Acinetobacter pittii]
MEKQLSVSLKGFNDENLARSVGDSLLSCFNKLNKLIDISRLELISVGYSDDDYISLLSEFRKGLNRTNDSTAVGAGMTVVSNPTDLRFRIFFSGVGICGLIKKHYDNDESLIDGALHTIAHEFIHVYVGTELYTNYSELLTTVTPQNIHQELKWKTILSCWDEYRVCSLCATFGEDPTENYESILKNTLHSFEENVAQAKIDRSDWGILLTRVYSEISSLLKYSSYYLGTCIGFEIDYTDTDLYKDVITKSWFCEYFDRLANVLMDIEHSFDEQNYDLDFFSNISDILVDIALKYKVFAQEKGDDVWVQLLS